MTATLVPVRRETRDPWDLASDLDRLFDTALGGTSARGLREGLWHPTMDVFNCKDMLVVELELPGLKRSDVDISIDDDHLIVEGTRNRSTDYKEEERYFSERPFGGFHRIVHLPTSVDADGTTAELKNGLLIVKMPKAKREGGQKIKIS